VKPSRSVTLAGISTNDIIQNECRSASNAGGGLRATDALRRSTVFDKRGDSAMIEYKGYSGVFEFDESIDSFHGRVIGLRDVVTFEGRSVDELRAEMAESVEDYLELCAEVGKDPDRPYRGEFLVRTTPDVHRAAAAEAEAEGISLNAWVEKTIKTVVRDRAEVGYGEAKRTLTGEQNSRSSDSRKKRSRSTKKADSRGSASRSAQGGTKKGSTKKIARAKKRVGSA
jgi:predicted HicB family RNase H-like nuclease